MNKKQQPLSIYEKLRRLSADDRLSYALLVPLSVYLFDVGLLSLKWRMVHDSPLFHYVAFLVDKKHLVLYKDVFETSMPGIFAFHLFIVKLFGYGDVAFRMLDITWLALLLAVTWRFMKPLGKRVAWASIVLFGVSYFQRGPMISLQRDYIGILPISVAVLLATALDHGGVYRYGKAFVIGLLFGLSATIKPHLAIGLPLVLFFLWRKTDERHTAPTMAEGAYICLAAALGFAIPVIICLIWLWQSGALPYFLEMVSSYLPLHLGLTYEHKTVFGQDRIMYLIRSYKQLGGLHIWLLPGFIGFYLAMFDLKLSSGERNLIYLLSGLAGLYSIYPVFAGQFWEYHWMPFQYFVILFSALALLRLPEQDQARFRRLFPVGVLILAALLALDTPVDSSGKLLKVPEIYPPVAWEGGRVDKIADFLKSNLEPGDRVQPLDWTGGAVQAMLLSKACAATPYIYDYHFYHHISEPYIQLLRRRFIDSLSKTKPRFIIDVNTQKPWVSGRDTTKEFKELKSLLKKHYKVAVKGDGYKIYKIRKNT
jgi:hypothetical protein